MAPGAVLFAHQQSTIRTIQTPLRGNNPQYRTIQSPLRGNNPQYVKIPTAFAAATIHNTQIFLAASRQQSTIHEQSAPLRGNNPQLTILRSGPRVGNSNLRYCGITVIPRNPAPLSEHRRQIIPFDCDILPSATVGTSRSEG